MSDENQTTPRACMVRDRISAYTICLICGGAGHAGYVDGLGQCLSARLDNRIPAEDLAQFKYPNGYKTAPRFRFSNSRPSSSNSRPSDISGGFDQVSNPSRPRTRQCVTWPIPIFLWLRIFFLEIFSHHSPFFFVEIFSKNIHFSLIRLHHSPFFS